MNAEVHPAVTLQLPLEGDQRQHDDGCWYVRITRDARGVLHATAVMPSDADLVVGDRRQEVGPDDQVMVTLPSTEAGAFADAHAAGGRR